MPEAVITQPEFRVPVGKAVPGMVLSRNLELRGATLLRFGTRLTQDHLLRLQEMGVETLHVHFGDEDVGTFKQLLLAGSQPPDREAFADIARLALREFIPPFARPQFCARSNEIDQTAQAALDHSLDVVFSSERSFDILRQARMFQVPCLRHCPAAWVYAICIGAGLGYNMSTLLDLSIAALFYDVGMLRVPARILSKPGKLTEQEWAQIKKHAYFGRKMLEGLSEHSDSAAMVAFEHHENYYGGGYPKGKTGSAIHEFSQIVSLADKFAAMVTGKDYRSGFQPYQAYELLLAQTRSSVSPRIFVAFLKSVLLYPRGSVLRLTSGELAVPVGFPLHLPTRPLIMVTHTRFGEELVGDTRTVSLAEHPELGIESFAIIDDNPRLHLPALG